MEIWSSGVPAPRGIQHVARDLEENGWDGLAVVDSQNLAADPFVALAMAATVTDRLKLGTAVANTVTRQPAVLASAAATVQSVSRGRMVLGIGRGDSALAHLGRAPSRLRPFERYLGQLQAYLAGESIPFADLVDLPESIAPPVAELDLAHAPEASRITWIGPSVARDGKVPVEIAATGPKVIAAAARQGDRVMFALGASPERLRWGMDLARAARREAGLDPDTIEFGAYIACGCHPDPETARSLVRGGLTVFARFAVMHGKTAGPLSPEAETVLQAIRTAYDMEKHTHGDSAQAGVLTPAFMEEYAAVGPPERVVERLLGLKALGLSKVMLNGGWRDGRNEAGPASKRLIEREVLPALNG